MLYFLCTSRCIHHFFTFIIIIVNILVCNVNSFTIYSAYCYCYLPVAANTLHVAHWLASVLHNLIYVIIALVQSTTTMTYIKCM